MSVTVGRGIAVAALVAAVAIFFGWRWRETVGAVMPGMDATLAAPPPAAPAPTASLRGTVASPERAATTPAESARTATPPSGGGEAPVATGPVVPSFDVVRVEPGGDSVIAGRVAPGATVELLRNGETYARAVADPSGLFAFVPKVLESGAHEIALAAIAPDGTRSQSAQSVTVVIAPDRRAAPLVTVTAPGQPTVVLSRPADPPAPALTAGPSGPARGAAAPGPVPSGRATPAATAPSAVANAAAPAVAGQRRPVGIDTVETEGEGRLYVAGVAAPGATLRLYLNDAFVAPGGTGPDGRLAFSIERGIRPGEYRVRLDDVDPVTGAVRSRAEVPFSVPGPALASATPSAAGRSATATGGERVAMAGSALPSAASAARQPGGAPASVVVPEIATAVVTRGETLWRISKRIYGSGLRYTVIYGANTPQIRNPDLIYPGQVFVLPVQGQPAIP